jgi:ABC-type nitrate/sulfonate/bicarbonate transport system substrate-binding protein
VALVTDRLDRRAFLRRSALGAAGAVVLGSPLLAACGGDSSSPTTTGSGGAANFGELKFQLSWIKNVEFAAEYLADSNGHYKDEGFSSVNLMAGGPNVQQDAVVASGSAFIGISAPDIAAAAINSGAEIIAVGAQYQKNPFCVMSLATKPINKPEDMVGKKIGVQSVNEPVWNAFLKANNLDPASITKVPVQFDPQPMVNGEVDGWFSFVTNEPNLLKKQGVDTAVLLLNDNGYPLVSEIYIVQTASLDKDRDKVKAVLRADIKGWHDSIKDPAAAPHLVVTKYGSDLGLDEDEQTLESRAQNELVLTDDTKANGLFTITDKLVSETMSTLKLAGIEIDQDKLFDLSAIEEVYKDDPDLKTSPTPG